MKKLTNLLNPRTMILGIGSALILGACSGEPAELDARGLGYYSFNLSGLETWMKPLFLNAGNRHQGIYVVESSESHDIAYLGELPSYAPSNSIAYTDNYEAEGNWHIKVIFKKGLNWVDCDIPASNGQDFYNVSEHEWDYHILGEGHPEIPNFVGPQRC